MEAMMSFLVVSLAIAALAWAGLKTIKAQREQVALQPIRIKSEQRKRR